MSMTSLALASLVPILSAASPQLPAQRIIEDRGMIRFAAGRSEAALAAPLSESARSFALDHAKRLGLEGLTLGPAKVSATGLGSAVRLQVMRDGLPVLGAEVVLGLDREGRVRRVASSARPVTSAVVDRRLTAIEAIQAAAQGVPNVLLRDGKPLGSWREVLVVRDGQARLAYQIQLASLDVLRNELVVVDAQTGEVLSRQNRVFFSDAAKVWSPNPGADAKSPLVSVELTPYLPAVADRNPDGHLVGALLDAVNCCVHQACDPAQPLKTITGTTATMVGPMPFETVFCDLRPMASNVGTRSDYDYSSPDPLSYDPPKAEIGSDPDDSNVFSEVHGFYHANVAYAFFRSLVPGFEIRDSMAGRKSTVLANFLVPDVNSATQDTAGTIHVATLQRVDNAAYIPHEQLQQLMPGLPDGVMPNGDVFALFQGPTADFSYDGDVVYHEFTHSVIVSTADFAGPHLDRYGADDEAGAMSEGLADYFAAALTNDPLIANFAGPRLTATASGLGTALRDLDNTTSCPSLLTGEVHNDSQHFSAALWAARKLFPDNNFKTYDTAILDALQTSPASAGFTQMAEAFAVSVADAFPSRTTAHDEVLAQFRSRGVVDCIKVIDYTAPRSMYSMPGTMQGYGPAAPGPVQLKLTVPADSTMAALRISAMARGSADPFGGGAPKVDVLVKKGAPITFAGSPSAITSDPDLRQTYTLTNSGSLTGTIRMTAAAGETIYVSVANKGAGPLMLTDLKLTLIAPDPVPEADAGVVEPAPNKCGCSSAGAAPLLACSLLLAGLARRRR